MEVKRRNNRARLAEIAVFLLFGLFFTATAAQGQILGLGPPKIDPQPLGTTVQNGDTVTLTASATCSLGNIFSVTWVYSNGSGGSLPTNAIVLVNGQSPNSFTPASSITTTLTLPHVSSACTGTYYVVIEDELLGGLLGLTTATATSQNANVNLIPTVTAVVKGSAMVDKGYKIQFSAPTGSNLVVQASTDLKNWTSLYTNVVTGGSFVYTDALAKTVSPRFYRAKLK